MIFKTATMLLRNDYQKVSSTFEISHSEHSKSPSRKEGSVCVTFLDHYYFIFWQPTCEEVDEHVLVHERWSSSFTSSLSSDHHESSLQLRFGINQKFLTMGCKILTRSFTVLWSNDKNYKLEATIFVNLVPCSSNVPKTLINYLWRTFLGNLILLWQMLKDNFFKLGRIVRRR